MKQELPIAIVLLAAGGWFWIWQNMPSTQQPNESSLQAQPIKITVDSQPGWVPDKLQQFEVASASFLEEVEPEPDTVAKSSSILANNSVPESQGLPFQLPPIYSKPADKQTTEFVRQIGDQLRNSPAFLAKFEVKLAWDRRDLEMTGEYMQLGKGSGQTKLSLHCDTTQGPLNLIKFCDGRFLYTLVRKPDSQQTLEFVDLRRVAATRHNSGFTNPGNPMSWISNGGLGSGMENLAHAFDFGPVQSRNINGYRTSVIEGRWKLNHLLEMLQASVDPNIEQTEPGGEHLPTQIPHAIEIELAEHPVLGQFPQTITFHQFLPSDREQFQRKDLAVLTFAEPVPISIKPSEFLKIDTGLADTDDITQKYINQIRDFKFFRQSRRPVEIQRR